MSHVSAALSVALEDLKLSQTELADQSSVDRTILNRYLRGAALGAENLVKLIRALPEPHKSNLAVAFIRDILPPEAASLVAIDQQSPRVQETPADRDAERITQLVQAFTADDRRDLRDLLERAVQHQPVMRIITSTASILRGE